MADLSVRQRVLQIGIPAGTATSLPAARGLEITCTRGRLWLTQAGEGQDFVLATGLRFCSAHDGRIVVTAEEGDAELVARLHPNASRHPDFRRSGVHVASSFDLHLAARRERNACPAGLVVRLVHVLAGLLRRARVPSGDGRMSGPVRVYREVHHRE